MSEMLLGGGQAGQAGADLVKDSNTQSFMKDVIEASRQQPVIVDFWAPWCGPCKQLGPALEKLVKAARGAVKMVKINVDENQQLAAQMRIQSIPAVFAFANGQPVDGFMGALPESQLKQFIDRLTAGSPQAAELDAVVAEAEALAAAGDAANAAQAFAEVLQVDREHAGALAGLAKVQIASGDLEAARATLALTPPAKQTDPAILSAKASLELAAKPVDTSQMAQLLDKLARDEADHQARLDLAILLNGAGRREEALDHLLAIIRKNRAWNDEAARKQLVTFFEAWGPKDDLTIAGRRRLSSILFS